jgi:hypothetical protein
VADEFRSGDWFGDGPALRIFLAVVLVAALIGIIGGVRNGCYVNEDPPAVVPQ